MKTPPQTVVTFIINENESAWKAMRSAKIIILRENYSCCFSILFNHDKLREV
ncbi:hypothetical protein HMPREF9506_01191 [Enterococcus faecalis TX0309A]|nr:hypothetical protein HMPREF9507_01902 [Enterococcus faecalis TX0309B]EFU94055.1 hypothetical protein HMPREF9506_01191 [Enterococcus faecalis TX0309A]